MEDSFAKPNLAEVYVLVVLNVALFLTFAIIFWSISILSVNTKELSKTAQKLDSNFVTRGSKAF